MYPTWSFPSFTRAWTRSECRNEHLHLVNFVYARNPVQGWQHGYFLRYSTDCTIEIHFLSNSCRPQPKGHIMWWLRALFLFYLTSKTQYRQDVSIDIILISICTFNNSRDQNSRWILVLFAVLCRMRRCFFCCCGRQMLGLVRDAIHKYYFG